MRKEFVGKIPVWFSIYDGHTRIERRAYVDESGNRFVKINGNFVELEWAKSRWYVTPAY